MKTRPLDTAPAIPIDIGDLELNNVILGGPRRNFIHGEGGDDSIWGQDGDDILVGEARTKSVDAGTDPAVLDNDLLLGGTGYDYILGDVETLHVDGGAGDIAVTMGHDILLDQDGGLLMGDADNLTITPSGGHVALITGNDTLAANDASLYGDAYSLTIEDLQAGSATVTLGDDLLVSAGSGWSQQYGDAYYLWIEAYGQTAGQVAVTAGNDSLVSAEGDALFGDFDWLGVFNASQATGALSVTVTCGDDLIIGGSGNDWMIGDYLDADTANTGGAQIQVTSGADTFVFTGSFGDDEIADFNTGLDILQFEGFTGLTFDDLGQTATADGLLVTVADALGSGTILLNGVDTITEDDVLFV